MNGVTCDNSFPVSGNSSPELSSTVSAVSAFSASLSNGLGTERRPFRTGDLTRGSSGGIRKSLGPPGEKSLFLGELFFPLTNFGVVGVCKN